MTDIYLGLDTATPYLAVAIWSPGAGVLARDVQLVEREHGARLIAVLEGTFASAGVDRSQLNAVTAGTGPGSYTGLRVGAAVALGLSRALGVPHFGCDTLSAVAFGVLEDGEEGLAALDARRGNIYVGHYRREGDELVTLHGPRKAPREEIVARYGALRLVEGSAPDPGFVARSALRGQPLAPHYL